MKKLFLLLAFTTCCYTAQPVLAQQVKTTTTATAQPEQKDQDKKDKKDKKDAEPKMAKGVVREKGVKNPSKTDFSPAEMTEFRLKELDKVVSLTPEQRTKAQALSMTFYQELEKLEPMKETDKNGFLAKNAELGKKAVADVRAILTPGQQAKFDAFEKERKQRKKK